MLSISTTSTANLLDNQEKQSTMSLNRYTSESSTSQPETLSTALNSPKNKNNFLIRNLRKIFASKNKTVSIEKINEEILELCKQQYLKSTSEKTIDKQITNVVASLSELSYDQFKKWFSSYQNAQYGDTYFNYIVSRNVKLAEKIFNIINLQEPQDITDLLELEINKKSIQPRENINALISLYFKTDIEFADSKLEQIFRKNPNLLYSIKVPYSCWSSEYKDVTKKQLSILDVAIKKEKINGNVGLIRCFFSLLKDAVKNKNYPDIKKLLEYYPTILTIQDFIRLIIDNNDAEALKLFAKAKVLLYVEYISYPLYERKNYFSNKTILPAISYAIFSKKNNIVTTLIDLDTNLDEAEVYYKLEYYDDKCTPCSKDKSQCHGLAAVSSDASDNAEYAKETFLPPLFYAILLKNHEIIDQLLAAGANKEYTLEYIYNELEKDLPDSKFIKETLLGLKEDTSYNAEIKKKLQPTKSK